MPNTLVHLGIQGFTSSVLHKKIDLRLVYISCVIPDIPWIIQRAIYTLHWDVDRIDLLLRSNIQASLIFSLVLCGAVAVLTKRPGKTLLTLSIGCIFHLLLDATQTKWGHGVLLFAPFNWQLFTFSWLWPEHLLFTILSCLSLVFVLYTWRISNFQPILASLNVYKITIATTLIALYLFTPVFLSESLHQSNTLQTKTFTNIANYHGETILLDRIIINHSENGLPTTVLKNGQLIQVMGLEDDQRGLMSIKAKILNENILRVEEAYQHPPYIRALWSIFGLCLVLLIFCLSYIKNRNIAKHK